MKQERDCLSIFKKIKLMFILLGPDKIPTFLLYDCATVISSPLIYLFNISVKYRRFPSIPKHSKVIPVFKSGDNNKIENYRPITILKIYRRFWKFFCINQYLHMLKIWSQHDLMKHRTTTTNVRRSVYWFFEGLW